MRSEHPTFHVHGSSLRAEESARIVFAVFYTDPELLVKPSRYKVIAVERDSSKTEEIDVRPESEYWIHGRK